jgi:ABC-type transport system involved in multi-copper enzyme maturation permease subunit
MIRFSWLQARVQTTWAIGVLGIIAAALAITGPRLLHLYNDTVAACQTRGDCQSALNAFLNNDSAIRAGLGTLLVCVPALLGMFWGAPLVAREFEAGTFRLAWTQGVTRTRWLAGKLGVLGLASMATTGLLSLMLTWWASPFDRASTKVFASFDQRDIAPVGYAVFALVLGVTAGIAIRRTVSAMAVTMVAYVVARIAMTSWLRPLLISPLHRSLPLDPASTGYGSSASGLSGIAFLFGRRPGASLQPATPTMPNTWIYSNRIVDGAGHGLTSQVLHSDCPTIGDNSGPGPSGGSGSSHTAVPAAVQQAMHNCVAKVGATYHQLVTYQPSSRYWAFQWYELAIFVGAAAVLGAVCFWAIRRRLS